MSRAALPFLSSYFAALVFLLTLCAGTAVHAQVLRRQPTPFSVWIDLRDLAAGKANRAAALPIWLDSVQFDAAPDDQNGAPKTPSVFRLHFRRMSHLNAELQLRLFFDDAPGRAPTVTGWSETGLQRFQSGPLGSGLELPTSESLLVPMTDVDDIEISVPGDGHGLRGVFLSTMQKGETHRALDFAPADAQVEDPFHNLPFATPQADDAFLYGRVRATLEAGIIKLSALQRGAPLEFELDQRPLLAVLTFEVLNVDPLAPPQITINRRPLGVVSLHAPDLADPGYIGSVRPLDREMHFRYAGWLRCQKVVPGSSLDAGLNQLTFEIPKQTGTIAIRAVELQLKNNWQNLEYKIVP
jgi:hypothetical protein